MGYPAGMGIIRGEDRDSVLYFYCGYQSSNRTSIPVPSSRF
jgi:hypothetical protein